MGIQSGQKVPILKVLESHNLSNILCVVVRYFGGIKLGANGLIRAYTKATANALKETALKVEQNFKNVIKEFIKHI